MTKKTGTFKRYFTDSGNQKSLSSDFIRSITQDKNGKLWVGTDNGGLNKISISGDGLQCEHFRSLAQNNSNYINHDNVLALKIDFSDNLWIGTLNGLDKIDLKPQKFKLYRISDIGKSVDLSDNVIASIYKDKTGKIWVGNWGKGLNIFDRKTGEVVHYSSRLKGIYQLKNDYVQIIFENSDGTIWIGTRNGMFVYRPDKKDFAALKDFYKAPNLPDFANTRIYCSRTDHRGDVWVGTQNGLFRIDLKNKTAKRYSADSKSNENLSDNLIYNLLEDKDRLMWIATLNGLDCYDFETDKFSHFKNDINIKNSLCDNFTTSLCEDYEGKIWIGTKNGADRFDKKTKRFEYFSQKEGLSYNMIYEILEDRQKNLWFATGRGLSMLNHTTHKFRNYGLEDGIQSLEFNLQARYKSPDGEMFFGGMNGFNSFYPDSIQDNQYIPNIAITQFEKNKGDSKIVLNISGTNETELSYRDVAFTIEFSALEFTNPLKNNYSYEMEGSSGNEFIEIGNRRFVPFSNLPPGVYTFRVKGSNNDGIWNQTGTSLRIIINPPWWKTVWAYIAYVLMILIGIYVFIKFRERNLVQARKILEKRVTERTHEIAMQKEEISTQAETLQVVNHELTKTNSDLELRKKELEYKNKMITDSIKYAKRIQSAVLPSSEEMNNIISDYFVLYKPKDIVSGDFYFLKKIKETVIIAIADCTGHGVPGAFMSMLGISLLNEVIRYENILQADQALNYLREKVKQSLSQSGKSEEQKDGLDIAFCALNTKTNVVQFAGAYNSLFLLRKSDLPLKTDSQNIVFEKFSPFDDINFYEIKADSQPVSIYPREKPFTNNVIQLCSGDILYMYTDGYADQPGGETGKKLLKKQFKAVLSEIYTKPMSEQQLFLDEYITNWMGPHTEQIDDVLVFGLKIF